MRCFLVMLVLLAPLAQAAPPAPPTLAAPPSLVPSPVPTSPEAIHVWAFDAVAAAGDWLFAQYDILQAWAFDVADYGFGVVACTWDAAWAVTIPACV